MKKKNFTKEELLDMKNEYLKHFSLLKIGKKYKCSPITVKKYLNTINIAHTSHENAGKRKRFVKENVFSELNENTYYWIGIMISDGWIEKDGRIGLSFKSEDECHLIKFQDYLKSNLNIQRKKHNKNNGLTSTVMFRNKEITASLNKYGVCNNKSFTVKLNLELNYDILRGIIDGDGNIDNKRNRIRIFSASNDLIDQLIQFLEKECINYSIEVDKRNGLKSICIRQQNSLIKLINNLYSDATVFLERKQITAYLLRNKLMKSDQIQGTSVRNPEPSL